MTQVLTPKVTLSRACQRGPGHKEKSGRVPLENKRWRNHSGTTKTGPVARTGSEDQRVGAGCLHGHPHSSRGGGWTLVPGLLAYSVWPGPEKQVFSVYWTCQKASVSLASGRESSPPRLALWRPGVVQAGWLGAPFPPALVRGTGESGVPLWGEKGAVRTI